MKQPTKDVLRDQLALAADEIIQLRQVIQTTKHLMGWHRAPVEPKPWWRRWFA